MQSGLINIGNSCYSNVVIQCLSYIFGDYFIEKKYKNRSGLMLLNHSNQLDIINENFFNENIEKYLKVKYNIDTTDKSFNTKQIFIDIVCENINNLINDIISGKDTKNNLINFYEHLLFFNKTRPFLNREQHDSHEFLISLIDLLHKLLSYYVGISIDYKSQPITDTNELQKYDITDYDLSEYNSLLNWKKEWKLKYDFNTETIPQPDKYAMSIVSNNICGQYKTTIQCRNLQCEYICEKYDIFYTICLDIHGATLNDCFTNFIKIEELDQDNLWLCPKCNTKTQCFRKTVIDRCPKYLIIQLKRFTYINTPAGLLLTKNNTNIELPMIDFNIEPFTKQKITISTQPLTYDLEFIILHHGNLNNGHYNCLKKDVNQPDVNQKDNNKWYFMDDETVNDNYNMSQLQNAYILVYKQK